MSLQAIELPPGWTAHKAPTGHTYYYHAETKKSTYKKPEVVKDDPIAPPIVVPSLADQVKQDQDKEDRKERRRLRQLRAHIDRPRYKIPITTTESWVKVITRHENVFYHNTDTKESSWEPPESILEALERWERGQVSDGQSDQDLNEEDEEMLDEQVEEAKQPQNTEFTEDDIAWQLEAMEGEEDKTDRPVELSPEAKRETFMQMLRECAVNPFHTFDAELENIASDPRYRGRYHLGRANHSL